VIEILELNKIYNMDCLEGLKLLDDNSIDCCVTSPPYWNLRDYGTEEQLGLEPNFNDYISRLCDIFDEVKRVLKPDGTCFVNLADTYSGSGKGVGSKSKESWKFDIKPKEEKLLPNKCLCCIPDRFKIEMINRRWICRNEIIWHKPNAMPDSATDRFTVDYEKIFFFTKQSKYYFEQQFEPIAESTIKRNEYGWNGNGQGVYAVGRKRQPGSFGNIEKGRNKRATWSINTKPFKEAHFATFPPELIEPCILAGCREGGIVLDPFMGSGTTGLVAKQQNKNYIGFEMNSDYCDIANKRINDQEAQVNLFKL
jgi:DNA modification methylase